MFNEMEIQLSAFVANPLAQLMLPNNVQVIQEQDEKKFTSLVERQEKLAEFLVSTGFQPFPFPEKVFILYKQGKDKHIPKWLITAWAAFPGFVEVITGREKMEKGVVKITPCEQTFKTKAILHLGEESLEEKDFVSTPYSPLRMRKC